MGICRINRIIEFQTTPLLIQRDEFLTKGMGLFSPREEGFILKCPWGRGKWLIHVVLKGKSPVKQSQNLAKHY